MTGTSVHGGNAGKLCATEGSASGVPRWHALGRGSAAGDALDGGVLGADGPGADGPGADGLGGDALARDARALDALTPDRLTVAAPAPHNLAAGGRAAGAPVPDGSASLPGPVVEAGAVPTASSAVRHPRHAGMRRRLRALRLGVGWAVLVAIGGATMLPAADALASGIDRPPYIVQQVVAASPTATSQGEGTRRD